ncbi:MAG: OmpH family outer membrane protein [Flavobacteriales bacterium]|nr:OmpH family outer membrane protein [Flavobacteriales bacterium]MDG1779403.1 OmpH family outer membrane protein [Flavobacteriales bacterium]MDG2245223.1 OmpH family outer membrane protein [Flavobacteriales bacterium]
MIQKIALGIAVVALGLGVVNFMSNDNTPEEIAPEMVMEDTTTEAEEGLVPRIAFVRGDSINLQYQFIIDKEDELISLGQVSERKLSRQLKKAETEYQELVTYLQSGSATESDMAAGQQRLMVLEQELQNAQAIEQQSLGRKEADFQQEIADRLSSFLERYANDNEYDLILNWGFSREGVLYGQAPYDITRDVINQLNAEYAAEFAPEIPEE